MTHEQCFVCRERPRERGVLCVACAAGLVADDVCAEQIGARASSPQPGAANAWLIDGFGVPHSVVVAAQASPAFRSVTIGRDKKSDVAVAERTVSQAHASLEHRPLSNAWFVVDHGSDNGTFVNDDRVPRRFPLEPRDRLFLGRRVGFLFVPLEESDLEQAVAELRWLRAQDAAEDTVGDGGGSIDDVLKVVAVTDGGAVATWGDERASLSELEYELLVVLHRRMREEQELDASARGFVPAAHLLDVLSFQSEAPTHANLRGLVKKLRRKLADREHPIDVIESRQGLGYRLARPIDLS